MSDPLLSSSGDRSISKKRIRAEEANHEEKIGIGCSMLSLTGQTFAPFHASIKTLFSDFVVREMSRHADNGNPLRLTTFAIPGVSAKADMQVLSDEQIAAADEEFRSLLDPEDYVLLMQMVRHEDGAPDRLLLQPVGDKARRTAIHQAVKQRLLSTFVSSAEEGRVLIQRATPALLRDQCKRGQSQKEFPFVHFTLYKENLDSSSAFRMIAQQLGISSKMLRFSGTKDKRGVTLQRICCRGVDPSKLSRLNANQFGRNATLKIGNIELKKEDLSLGDLVGNYFEIVLRVVDGALYEPGSPTPAAVDPAFLAAAANVLAKHGFVNYFGPQRFGTTSVLTSDVGRAVLRGAFEDAFWLVLASKCEVSPELQPAVQKLREALAAPAGPWDVSEALKATPHYCFQERDMIKHLADSPKDFRGCFACIARTMTMLYCHSVQSLVWNRMVTQRLQQEGPRPVVGDLVFDTKTSHVGVDSDQNAIDVESHVDDADVETDSISVLPSVRHVTQADIDNNAFSLSDVVMTVPGPDAQLVFPLCRSANRQAYVAMLTELDCGSLLDDAHDLARQYHFHGTYRRVAVVPQALEVEQMHIASFRQPVLKTDLDRIREIKQKTATRCGGNTETENCLQSRVGGDALPTPSGPSFCAVIVRFALPPGCYATSLLRELCVCVKE